MLNGQCASRSVHTAAEPCVLQPQTPNTEHTSQLNQIVFISRAFMSTCSLLSCNPAAHRVCDQPSLSCEKCSFISSRGRLTQIQNLLCGQFSTASSCIVRALFTYMHVYAWACTRVCVCAWEGRECSLEYTSCIIITLLKILQATHFRADTVGENLWGAGFLQPF